VIKQFVAESACLECRGCCRFQKQESAWSPCLLEEEMLELADRPGIPAVNISIEKKIIPIPDIGNKSFVCPFLNLEDNKCKIYATRPFECQLYPFLIAFRDKKILLTIDLNCPYVAEKANSQEFKDYVQYLTDFLNSPQQLKVLKDNPQILQAYEEVLDVVELQDPHEIK
jgi:Fe-S-cluster containining protein